MSTLIFLDDEREFESVNWIEYPLFDEVIVVRNFEDFKLSVESNKNKELYFSFDHDLGIFDSNGRDIDGYICAKWLCDFYKDYDLMMSNHMIFVHSKNPIGSENIRSYIQNFIKWNM